MGLLDDAIREHLDLKRRRGADPTEIEQAEREALGPARRDPFENVDAGPHAAVADEPAYDQAAEDEAAALHPEDDWGDAFDDEHPPEPAFEQSAPPASHAADVASAPPPHPADAPPGEETVEYDVEEALDGEEPDAARHEPPAAPPEPEHTESAPKEADVLEETPEFLQDTPDHDRLWFEQRPPRDFDFDG